MYRNGAERFRVRGENHGGAQVFRNPRPAPRV